MFKYTKPQIALHWLMALLIGYQLIFDGGIAQTFGQAMRADTAPQFDSGARIHLIVGLSILVLVLPRLIARLRSPAAPEEPGLMGLAARIVHGPIYLMMVVMPVAGLIAWFGRSETAADLHSVGGNLLIALVLVHIGAALYHQFIRKDGLIGRMMPH